MTKKVEKYPFTLLLMIILNSTINSLCFTFLGVYSMILLIPINMLFGIFVCKLSEEELK